MKAREMGASLRITQWSVVTNLFHRDGLHNAKACCLYYPSCTVVLSYTFDIEHYKYHSIMQKCGRLT